MFKYSSIVFAAILSIALAETIVEVTKHNQDLNPDGSYAYEYAQSNGVAVEESGVAGQSVAGSYQYQSPDGESIKLQYTADENGFHPEGEHLPTSPPIPEYILRAVEYIRSHPPADEVEAEQRNRVTIKRVARKNKY